MIKKIIRNILKPLLNNKKPLSSEQKIKKYLTNGRVPWSEGYNEHKWQEIQNSLNNDALTSSFNKFPKLENYGIAIDERIVEYPWIISNLSNKSFKFLDAGSTFNFNVLLNLPIISLKEKTIITYYPEHQSFNQLKVNYIYSDLRDIPIKDGYFEEIVCQSTLEHIDMDNSIYGYKTEFNNAELEKSYEYLKVVIELIRVLKKNGKLLITVPFGLFENHGFFQQFDYEMINRIIKIMEESGVVENHYFIYKIDGWKISNFEECKNSLSYNPHTGNGKGNDNAAHSRAICCIKFLNSK